MRTLSVVSRLAQCSSLLVIAMSFSTTSLADAGPPGGLSVNVVNTPANPVPVIGSTTVSGTVAATQSGTWTVNANIQGSPTVKIAPDMLYQQEFVFTGSVVGHCSTTQGSVTVPDGKVLIIESVFVGGGSTKGSPIVGVLQVEWNNVNHAYRFSPTFAGVDGETNQDQYNGTFPTKILAQARTNAILVDGCSLGPLQAGSQSIEVILAGHFVDAQ